MTDRGSWRVIEQSPLTIRATCSGCGVVADLDREGLGLPRLPLNCPDCSRKLGADLSARIAARVGRGES